MRIPMAGERAYMQGQVGLVEDLNLDYRQQIQIAVGWVEDLDHN